jgi:hypothetical protein
VGTLDGGQRRRLRAAQPEKFYLMTTAPHWLDELYTPSGLVEKPRKLDDGPALA